ncbi:hypothetical protein CPC08DRAFT_717389 [Agrocybe pediades]|nr:hypothetical protein CPC08DRAFT_717389 [Agrocybe pediades]
MERYSLKVLVYSCFICLSLPATSSDLMCSYLATPALHIATAHGHDMLLFSNSNPAREWAGSGNDLNQPFESSVAGSD